MLFDPEGGEQGIQNRNDRIQRLRVLLYGQRAEQQGTSHVL